MPGGRRERRLQDSLRSRTARQVSVSVAIVAFAMGAVTSASATGIGGVFVPHGPASLAEVPPIHAAQSKLEVVTETAEITLDPASRQETDPYAMAGNTRVVTEGEAGSAIVSYNVTYQDGVEVSRVETITVVIKPARDEVIAVGSLVVPATTAAQQGTNRALGQQMASDLYGWAGDEWACLDALWKRESNWRHTAENKSSGAYGIPQALPGSKMATKGDDWRTNPATQIEWGLGYIKNRYGTPCGAWAHSEEIGWY
ncbi:MAG: hypothetical protein CVT64_07150 [Actinobacteria bacterium HGW-Actinobacteria-4]|nr:MAG: hypothetical protein CVT64_07150 [Actinobacteria bacterium HGW-Actinobacteria-4]